MKLSHRILAVACLFAMILSSGCIVRPRRPGVHVHTPKKVIVKPRPRVHVHHHHR